jgi:hypothetical protein
MHLFAHLNDIDHSRNPEDIMFNLTNERDLDRMATLSDKTQRLLHAHLVDVGDPRVEERVKARNRIGFYLKAAWVTRREILAAVRRIQPWQFPLRYSKLTTAAGSSLLVLLMTAEAWELAMTQTVWHVVLLSAAALLGTSSYLVWRQHLLSRLGHHLSEQSVVTTASISIGVFLGMCTTYGLLLLVTWVMAHGLFTRSVILNWVPNVATLTRAHYVSLAGFVGSVGITIGALGASFEQEDYFRHMAMLDEET